VVVVVVVVGGGGGWGGAARWFDLRMNSVERTRQQTPPFILRVTGIRVQYTVYRYKLCAVYYS